MAEKHEKSGHAETPNFTIEHSLQIHVATLATLSGVLVDVSQKRLMLTVILSLASFGSIYLTDRRRLFQIPRFVVSLVTLGAILPLLNGFLDSSTVEQLLAISHLLTVWLAVMFFQAKSPRVYGSLIVLSLLMVVVAAVLSGGPFFGILLLSYVFVGLSSMCLLYVHREELLMREAALIGAARETAANIPRKELDEFLRGQRPIAYQVLDRGRGGSLWVPGLPWQIAGLGMATLCFAAGFFYFVPRLGEGDWSQQRPGPQAKVGFSRRVTFEEMGEILQSNQLAMRVSFFQENSQTLYPIFGDCYFSGQAMADYRVDEKGQAAWRPYESYDDGRPLRIPRTIPSAEIVKQEIILEPSDDATVFSVTPAYPIRGSQNSLMADRFNTRLFRSEYNSARSRKQFRYILNTGGFRNGAQIPLIPFQQLESESREVRKQITPAERSMLTQIDRARFPKLIEIAQQIALESEDPKNRILVMRRLQSHFLSESEYIYTLDMRRIEEVRRRHVDPVEDFVANHHMGHCKFFASALVLMLRSQGIPARLVVGYHGGEFNRLGNYYQVYERDAHAWVEAYLEPDQVPEGVFGEPLEPDSGAWYRLDPTPGGEANVQIAQGVLRAVDQTLDYMQLLWTNYILDMSPDRQSDTGLDLMTEEGPEYLANLRMVRQSFESVKNLLTSEEDYEATGATARLGRWSLIGALLVLGLIFFAGSGWGFHRLSRRRRNQRLKAGRKQLQSDMRQRKLVAFYQRLERILERIGYRRKPSQTQREFVQSVNGQWELPAGTLDVLQPDEVVEFYYRVRFGNQQLQSGESAEIAESLEYLEQHLKPPPSPS